MHTSGISRPKFISRSESKPDAPYTIISTAVAFLLLFSLSAGGTAQTQSYGSGSYFGKVTGITGEGVFGDVQVTMTRGDEIWTRAPNSYGWFAFHGLLDGDYAIKVSKPGHRGPRSRALGIRMGMISPPRLTEAEREYALAELDADTFTYHWEEDQTTAGYEYSAHVNEPIVVEFLGEEIEVIDDSSAIRLERDYGVLLVDGPTGTWTQEHAYRLLETMKAIPQRKRGSSRWSITSQNVHNDIQITGGGADSDRTVVLAADTFVNAASRMAQIDGKRGKYYSRRLHHALVRFVTADGTDKRAYESILQERYGVTTDVIRHTTYRELTAHTTAETSARFQDFHAEEIVDIINTFEEMPSGMRQTPGLNYLVRRRDGHPHPLYTEAPAVAWTGPGYIEFMGKAFSAGSALDTHRLIIHEKSHFLWAHVFDVQLISDWIELGGWYETTESPSGWWTTKQTEFVSAYAHLKNPNEDMAESMADFVVNPDKLRSRAIGKYEFIRDRIMQGDIYISIIREDLTFEVFNLWPDYVFPGKIRRVDIQVTGAADEDKTVRIEVELHALDAVLEGAEYVVMRIYSEDDTYVDKYLYPRSSEGRRAGGTGTVLWSTFTMSKHVKSGYWIPSQVKIGDEHGNQRFQSSNDFGWQMYLNNSLEDLTAPQYVANTASLTKTTAMREGREIQIVHARWQVDEDVAMRDKAPCYAAINDELLSTYSFQEYGTYDERGETCEVDFTMPDYMPSSTYSLDYIAIRDQAEKWSGVYFGHPGHGLRADQAVADEPAPKIELTTGNPDTEAPQLDLNTIQISAIPTNPSAPNGETVVTLTFKTRDNISGLQLGSLRLRDPQGIEHHFYVYPQDRSNLFPTGDPTKWTTHVWTVILPQGSAPGIWGLAEMTLRDRANNFRTYDFTEILYFEVIQ